MVMPGTGSLGASLNLYRSDNPKYTTYLSDGMGRDGYILRHNGGLCHERELNFSESTRFSSPLRYCNPAPLKETTAIKYCSDGSGRDSYILYNSGGNHVESVPGGYKSF